MVLDRTTERTRSVDGCPIYDDLHIHSDVCSMPYLSKQPFGLDAVACASVSVLNGWILSNPAGFRFIDLPGFWRRVRSIWPWSRVCCIGSYDIFKPLLKTEWVRALAR